MHPSAEGVPHNCSPAITSHCKYVAMMNPYGFSCGWCDTLVAISFVSNKACVQCCTAQTTRHCFWYCIRDHINQSTCICLLTDQPRHVLARAAGNGKQTNEKMMWEALREVGAYVYGIGRERGWGTAILCVVFLCVYLERWCQARV